MCYGHINSHQKAKEALKKMCNVQYLNYFTLSFHMVEATTYSTIKHMVIMVSTIHFCFWYFKFGPPLYTRPM
jgi:hypothetical protein